jgi:hypothetical protein
MDVSYRFDYVSAFEVGSFKEHAIVLRARSLEQLTGTQLAGHHPKLRFCNDRLVLIADGSSDAAVRWASFPVGDAVLLIARPGDVLQVLRTAASDLALWILRNEHLMFALGALSGACLGDRVRVAGDITDSHGRRGFVDVSVESRHARLTARESASAGGYEIYVERPSACCAVEDDGFQECVSIVRAAGDPRLRNAAIRSAVLLAEERPDMLQAERWDGRVIRWSRRTRSSRNPAGDL